MLKELGRGTYGQVSKAKSKRSRTTKFFAIKIIPKHMHLNQASVNSLMQELEAMKRI